MVLVLGFELARENRLTSVCGSSTIHGRRLLSFACPKESNQRKRHPRGRGHAGIHARVTTRAGSGVRSRHIPVPRSDARASCARPRAVHAAISSTCSPRPRGNPEGQSAAVPAAEAPDICDTGYIRHVGFFLFRFALRVPSEQRRRADGPAARSAGGARDRADSDNRPWMACGPNPSTRSEPSAKPRARIRGCRFLWLLSFGQAKESNWRPWMADITHTDVSRFSRQSQTTNPTPSPPNPPLEGEG